MDSGCLSASLLAEQALRSKAVVCVCMYLRSQSSWKERKRKLQYNKCMLCKNNLMYKHRMGDNCLSSSIIEKDLLALVDHRLNLSQQCDVVAKKAIRV